MHVTVTARCQCQCQTQFGGGKKSAEVDGETRAKWSLQVFGWQLLKAFEPVKSWRVTVECHYHGHKLDNWATWLVGLPEWIIRSLGPWGVKSQRL